MKTYKQFSEDMKKNFQTFLNNPETQDFISKVKNTKIGDAPNLKKNFKTFAGGQAFQQLKFDSLTNLQNKSTMGVNKIFDTLKSNFNVTK